MSKVQKNIDKKNIQLGLHNFVFIKMNTENTDPVAMLNTVSLCYLTGKYFLFFLVFFSMDRKKAINVMATATPIRVIQSTQLYLLLQKSFTQRG